MARIGLDLRMVSEIQSGIGRYSLQLVKNIFSLNSEHEYYVIFNQNNIAQERLAELLNSTPNIVFVQTSSRHYSFSEQTAFLKQLNKLNLDLIHFMNFNLPVFYKKPYVVTIHDMVHHKISGNKKSHLLHFLAYKKVIETAAKKARAVITVSQNSKNDIINFLQVQARKVEVVYEGSSLNPEVESEKLDEVKEKYLLSKPYFLFVGVLERKKNIVSLTRGFNEFLEKYKLDMDLVIAGPVDKHYPEIKHKALDIKNNNRVVFTDFVEDEDLPALYKGAFAFVSSSLHEGFGLPGVEAMKFGLPLAVSNIKTFNEVYDNSAVYFNPLDTTDIAEKLFLLANDKQYYEELSKKSLKRSEMFSWQSCAKKTIEIYNQITLLNK